MTHGYRFGATHRPEPDVQSYAGHQALIEQHYLRMAADTGAEIAPAGLVWQQLFAAHPALVLHARDNRHSNYLGPRTGRSNARQPCAQIGGRLSAQGMGSSSCAATRMSRASFAKLETN